MLLPVQTLPLDSLSPINLKEGNESSKVETRDKKAKDKSSFQRKFVRKQDTNFSVVVS